jgi:hypothetical protein
MTPEQTAIRARFQSEFDDGARCGFHRWSPERRDAWHAGFNRGFHDRLRRSSESVR